MQKWRASLPALTFHYWCTSKKIQSAGCQEVWNQAMLRIWHKTHFRNVLLWTWFANLTARAIGPHGKKDDVLFHSNVYWISFCFTQMFGRTKKVFLKMLQASNLTFIFNLMWCPCYANCYNFASVGLCKEKKFAFQMIEGAVTGLWSKNCTKKTMVWMLALLIISLLHNSAVSFSIGQKVCWLVC